MKEEISNWNNELSDAELEGVSGGASEEDVLKICASCLTRKQPLRYSCAYGGGDWMEIYVAMVKGQVMQPTGPCTNQCPYLRHS